jgi:hypothetical protein
MKRGTTGHPKTKALARNLGVSLPTAIGTLQLLWEFASEYAPDGAIGKFSDEYIAEECGWAGDPGGLIAALTAAESRWVDTDGLFRLVVHDWPDHCEDSVHNKLARSKKFFASGAAPKLSRLSRAEREETERFYQEFPVASARHALESARGERTEHALKSARDERLKTHAAGAPTLPCLSLPVPALPKPVPIAIRASAPPSEEIGEAAIRMYDKHPKKADLPLVPDALDSAVKAGTTLAVIEECHAAWCESEDWTKNGGRYAPKLATWLVDRGYTRWPPGHARNRPEKPQGTIYQKVSYDAQGNVIYG